MKEDTKKIVLIGGAALAALYAYSTMGGEDYAGMGGGGGAPLLPSIVEAATGAETAAPIIVNIPPMPTPVWDTDVSEYTKKNGFTPGGIPIPTSPASDETKKYGGFYLPELRAASFEFFESDIFAQQSGLMTRKRTGEVISDMLSESKERGFIKTSKKIAIQGYTPPKRSGVTYGPRGQSYNVPGVTYGGKGGITYSRPAGPPRPKKYSPPGSPD